MAEGTNPTPGVSPEQFAELQKVVADQQKLLAEQAETIAGLKGAKIEEKAKEPVKLTIPEKKVSVKGKPYKFTVAVFQFDGKRILSEDAALDNDLLEKIVAIEGQGILKKQF